MIRMISTLPHCCLRRALRHVQRATAQVGTNLNRRYTGGTHGSSCGVKRGAGRAALAGLLGVLAPAATQAGGYLTNTNQSVAFLRNPARDAAIGIDGAYSNPAGISFLTPGWHFGLNLQNAHQTRTVKGTFGVVDAAGNAVYPFSLGRGNAADGYKRFKGKAVAPVIPGIDAAWVGRRWNVSAHFGITGGGGKCKFNDGLGLFESQAAMAPLIINMLQPGVAQSYAIDTYMRGRQYYWGGQLNVGVRVNRKLSLSVGVRGVYASTNYYGYVRNISVGLAPQALGLDPSAGLQYVPVQQLLTQQGMPTLAALGADRNLDVDQSGWGYTPILGIDWKSGRWNLAAKWEFKTRLRLHNDTRVNTSGLAEYDDDLTYPADLPTILAGGIQYTALPDSSLRLNVGAHWYHDKAATQYEHRENLLGGDGFEFLAGAEWDITDWATASIGGQYTNYGLGDGAFLSNISFVTDSWSLGLGARFKLNKHIALDVAYFKTFYKSKRKDMNDYNDLKESMTQMVTDIAQSGTLNETEQAALQALTPALSSYSTPGKDHFDRTNDVFGIGLDISF